MTQFRQFHRNNVVDLVSRGSKDQLVSVDSARASQRFCYRIAANVTSILTGVSTSHAARIHNVSADEQCDSHMLCNITLFLHLLSKNTAI